MLPPRPAKSHKAVAADIMAAFNGDFFDRPGHMLHRDGDKALRHRLRRHFSTLLRCDLLGQRLKSGHHAIAIQLLRLIRAKNGREMIRGQNATHHIAIGDR
ncbi:hypothetical protein AQ1_01975 [alpha proteobacterium Q-1]|nr:hypothetical protein AQ1_01975 [alpha proteobacterium Q-1]